MLFFLLCFIWHSLSSDSENKQTKKERKTELIKEIDIQNFELRMIEKILNFASFEVIRIRRIERMEKSLKKELNQKVILENSKYSIRWSSMILNLPFNAYRFDNVLFLAKSNPLKIWWYPSKCITKTALPLNIKKCKWNAYTRLV